jgi:hypothetical protein
VRRKLTSFREAAVSKSYLFRLIRPTETHPGLGHANREAADM